MNAGLADGTTTGDLVLQQPKIVPQTQHFFDFSHGQTLLGHSFSSLARGEIPILVVQHRFPLLLRKLDPETSISIPIPTRLFHHRSDYSRPPGISIHMPRNTHSWLWWRICSARW